MSSSTQDLRDGRRRGREVEPAIRVPSTWSALAHEALNAQTGAMRVQASRLLAELVLEERVGCGDVGA